MTPDRGGGDHLEHQVEVEHRRRVVVLERVRLAGRPAGGDLLDCPERPDAGGDRQPALYGGPEGPRAPGGE